jgi:hypothetical protein
MTPPSNGWKHAAAVLLYAAISVVFVGAGTSLTGRILGAGSDTQIFIWFLAWWPWAVAHHANLLHTGLVWQPLGMPVMWVTSVPLLALLAAPVTLLAGPVLSYNLLLLMLPVASAFCAYLLCRRIIAMAIGFDSSTPAMAGTGSFPAALVGGYLFGFSSYETAANLATINLGFALFVPCLVLLALRRLAGEVSRPATVALAGLMMACQFLVSVEIFATITVFAFITWLVALRTLPDMRGRLRLLLADAVITGLVVLLVLSPFLASMARHAHYLALPAKWPYIFTANLVNFYIPTTLTWLGGQAAAPISAHFIGDLQEQGAFLGLPLIAILYLYARRNYRLPQGRFLIFLLLVLIIASLGPRLWIGGIHLPLLSAALPARFAMFTALAAAVIAALWIGQGRPWRIAIGVLACVALLPRPHVSMAIPTSVFFAPGRVQQALGPQPRLLVLPFGSRGPSTYWQMQNRFGYDQSGGYLGYPPAAMQHFAVVEQLFDGFELPSFAADLREFCTATATQYIIAGPGTPPGLWEQLGRLNWPARKVDDVTIFTVPPASIHG